MTPLVRKAGIVLLWVVTVVEVVGIGAAGAAKFTSDAWPRLFEGWGYPAGFVFLIGAVEAAGALCLLAPRLAAYAALLLTAVMLGAIATLVSHPGSQPALTGPVVHLALLGVIIAVRWKARWQPGTQPDRLP